MSINSGTKSRYFSDLRPIQHHPKQPLKQPNFSPYFIRFEYSVKCYKIFDFLCWGDNWGDKTHENLSLSATHNNK
jgi:hypothetical protein